MSTRVTVTGTGTPLLSPDRAGAGCLVSIDDLHLQFDVGRWTMQRLASLDVTPWDLDAIFLTHYHSDHLLGLQEIALTHWTAAFRDDSDWLPVVAPLGHTTAFCDRMLDAWDADLAVRSLHNHREPVPRIDVRGFAVPEAPTEVWSSGDGSVRVLAGPVRHEPVEGAVGYRIETSDGVVAVSGDTLVCDELRPLFTGADVVVVEAMRMDVINERPPHLRYITEYHADTRLIGALCAELEIPTVLLTHMIPAPETPEQKQAFVDEVRSGGFEGELVVCDDLDGAVIADGAVRTSVGSSFPD